MPTNHYSQDEVQYLIQHYRTKTSQEIADELGRSVYSVQVKLARLRKDRVIFGYRRNWTPEEDADLLGYIRHYTISKIAGLMGRPDGSIRQHLDDLNANQFLTLKKAQGYIDTPELEAIFGTTRSLVRRWRRNGLIRYERMGREQRRYCYPIAEVYRFIREHTDEYSIFQMAEGPFRSYALRLKKPLKSTLLNTNQVALMKNCCRSTVTHAARAGKLKGTPPKNHADHWKFAESDVRRWGPEVTNTRMNSLARKRPLRRAA